MVPHVLLILFICLAALSLIRRAEPFRRLAFLSTSGRAKAPWAFCSACECRSSELGAVATATATGCGCRGCGCRVWASTIHLSNISRCRCENIVEITWCRRSRGSCWRRCWIFFKNSVCCDCREWGLPAPALSFFASPWGRFFEVGCRAGAGPCADGFGMLTVVFFLGFGTVLADAVLDFGANAASYFFSCLGVGQCLKCLVYQMKLFFAATFIGMNL